MSKFKRQLRALINKHSMEMGSNTPDFVLAEYLKNCLKSFDKAIKARERYYGRSMYDDQIENNTIIKSDSIGVLNTPGSKVWAGDISIPAQNNLISAQSTASNPTIPTLL